MKNNFNKVLFIIQLEIEIDNKWYPVTRFDTKHGFAHQDICHYNGKIDKINLGINNYNIAMTFAEQDLKRNWNIYKGIFEGGCISFEFFRLLCCSQSRGFKLCPRPFCSSLAA